jgi:hypothetical protein
MKAFDTPRPVELNIELVLGDVHLIASDRRDTVVMVNPSDPERKVDVEAARQTLVELAGTRLLVRTPKARGMGMWVSFGPYGSVDLVIELPEGSRVDATTGMAHVRCDGRLGETRIKNGAGDVVLDQTGPLDVAIGAGRVSVARVAGPADVTSAGDMHIGLVEGDADIKNQSGRTNVGEVKGRLRVRSSNGDIKAGRTGGDLTAKTANGYIEIGELSTGTANLQTAAGGIDVGIRNGTAAWVDAKTGFGRVQNALESTRSPDPSQTTVELTARTSFGDIAIHRARPEEEKGFAS